MLGEIDQYHLILVNPAILVKKSINYLLKIVDFDQPV